jgi:methionyl aminopeptidase
MVRIKSDREIELIAEACKIVAKLLKEIKNLIHPGVKTIELDEFAENFIHKCGGKPAFKQYIPHYKKYYPNTICTSVNESIIHEIPSNRKLKEGDIISIDVGVIFEEYYGDGAWTFTVGKVEKEKEKLITTTYEALWEGIKMAKVGNRVGDISFAIENCVRKNGFFVAYEFTGHGIGRKLHEDPAVPNWGKKGEGIVLEEGMTITIEPMVNMGTHLSKMKPNGWQVVTYDGLPSVHFEHTIAIKKEGPQVLTWLKNEGKQNY